MDTELTKQRELNQYLLKRIRELETRMTESEKKTKDVIKYLEEPYVESC